MIINFLRHSGRNAPRPLVLELYSCSKTMEKISEHVLLGPSAVSKYFNYFPSSIAGYNTSLFAQLATSRRQHHALKIFLCICIQELLCSGTKTQKCSDLSTILLPGLSGRSTATCRTNCRLAPLLFFPILRKSVISCSDSV